MSTEYDFYRAQDSGSPRTYSSRFFLCPLRMRRGWKWKVNEVRIGSATVAVRACVSRVRVRRAWVGSVYFENQSEKGAARKKSHRYLCLLLALYSIELIKQTLFVYNRSARRYIIIPLRFPPPKPKRNSLFASSPCEFSLHKQFSTCTDSSTHPA